MICCEEAAEADDQLSANAISGLAKIRIGSVVKVQNVQRGRASLRDITACDRSVGTGLRPGAAPEFGIREED